ncbi:MAG: rhamnogalacturonan lyase, partial [Oscillospiraceae bacterium]|nr:rhamnogalacturonan lyase [Oscillospiraceae bacterium]
MCVKNTIKLTSALLSIVLLRYSGMYIPAAEYTVSASSVCTAEYLDRGINAINTGSGMLVSWRFLANDPDDTVFMLYRDGSLIYTSDAGMATCYLDKGGSAYSSYRVDTIAGGNVISSDTCGFVSGGNYFNIPMDVPAGGTTPDGVAYTYSPNDCSAGDVDGDGVYEIFVKWDPSNAKDNSHSGYTGNVYIDCYRLSGEKIWRVDLGKNIRAGAHYTQFLVADFDLDGRVEMTCKTA